jgi:hypothetical protein
MNAQSILLTLMLAAAVTAPAVAETPASPHCDGDWLANAAKTGGSFDPSDPRNGKYLNADNKLEFGSKVCPESFWAHAKREDWPGELKDQIKKIQESSRGAANAAGTAAHVPTAAQWAASANEEKVAAVRAMNVANGKLPAGASDAAVSGPGRSPAAGPTAKMLAAGVAGAGIPGSGRYKGNTTREVPSPSIEAASGAAGQIAPAPSLADFRKNVADAVVSGRQQIQEMTAGVKKQLADYKTSLDASGQDAATKRKLFDEYRGRLMDYEAKYAASVWATEAGYIGDLKSYDEARVMDRTAIEAERVAIKITRVSVRNKDRHEYGGLILKDKKTGAFSFTQPIRGDEHSIGQVDHIPVPAGFTEVATYHTHPHTLRVEDGGGASGEDMINSKYHHRPGYVGETVTGDVWRYGGGDAKDPGSVLNTKIGSVGE